jgi:type II secretory pathway component GspD/PulD (secretin)
MVMVQVVIAEVELNDASESGVEFGMQDSLLADRGLVLGNSITQDQIAVGEVLAATATSALGVGRSSATFGYGGMVLSAANESINVILRALQDEGRLQILSRPQIMTLDNVEAFVQVGARVPRLTGTTITATGQVNNTEDVDVGLLLTVRPRVSPDGLIIMEVGAEKSEVGNPEDGIPVAITANGPVLSPQINTTTARTVISAHSGQTVVFAGLITKSKLKSRRAVPYLGELPYIGPLFRYDVESEKRTELLIILTPYILEGDEDIDQLKHLESDRMSWCLSDLLEMHGDVGLSPGRGFWGDDEHTSTIYPDLDPTGSASKPEGKAARSMVDVLPGNEQDPTTAKRSAARPVRLPQVPRQRAVVNPPPEASAVQPTSYYPAPNYNP